MLIELSEQEIQRRKSLEELRKIGYEPYPAEKYEINTYSEDIKEQYDSEKKNLQSVSLAGRLMNRRIMGSASFAELQDEKGSIQLYFKRDNICPGEDKTAYNTVFKKLLDIGDIIGVEGSVFKTKVGETSINITSFKVLS